MDKKNKTLNSSTPDQFDLEGSNRGLSIAELSNKELSHLDSLSIEEFWQKQSERIHWYKKATRIKNTSFKKPVSIKWFEDAELNVCYNCVDRHLPKRADKVALIWEPDNPSEQVQKITYQELFKKVNQMSAILRELGVQKGDFVTIYMPMIPEVVYAMLACSRLGAPHCVVFGGFAPDSLSDRIHDCESKFVITADEGVRGGKSVALKSNVDLALKKAPTVEKVLVIQRTGGPVSMTSPRDFWYHDLQQQVDPKNEVQVEPVPMGAEDPLFILYTSGSTNKPKGVLHTGGGYLLYASFTHEKVFDYQENDIYWCTADVGWITGHSYLVYGPLTNGATTLLFEGVPHYPNFSRFWEVIDKHQVSIFYTAPTALRSLMREGDDFVTKTSRQSLRILGSVGEPINPEAWDWYHHVVGNGRCPIVDTWWQTETGGILISPLPGITKLKPGSGTFPLIGIKPKLLTLEGKVIDGPGEGVLVFEDSWPGQMRTVFKNHHRFEETYFTDYPGYYFTGDGCRRDEDGYYWITGRVDDVIKISGHRIGTAEVESALDSHHDVAESAVVGFPHDIKGQGIYAFVILKAGVKPSESLKADLVQQVRREIGPIATPEKIQWAMGLPKTRSGKIMRRILRKIAENNLDSMGDLSTLSDPSVVETLIKDRI